MGGFVQISFGWIGSILVPYFRHIIILVILRLNEGFFFRWEVVALFGSCYGERWSSVFSWFIFVCLLPHGASCSTAYRCIRFSFFVCRCAFFPFVLLSSEARRRFFFHFLLEWGWWDSREKKIFYLIFFYYLL